MNTTFSINGDSVTVCHDGRSCTLSINKDLHELQVVHASERSEIYRFTLNGRPYAIKLMVSSLSEATLFFLNTELPDQNTIRRTLFVSNLSDSKFRSIVCYEFVEGEIVHRRVSASLDEGLMNAVLTASEILRSVDHLDPQFETISQKIRSCTRASGTEQVRAIGAALQEYCEEQIPDELCTQLCLYDLHRENLVLNRDGWHIIDTESVIIGTDTFMFSCLLAASFLLEGYLPRFVMNAVTAFCDNRSERVCIEIMVRLYIGIAFFSQMNGNDLLLSKYMDSLRRFVLYLESSGISFSDSFRMLLQTITASDRK